MSSPIVFGALTTNLAAISAAICTGPDAHPDPAQRWKASAAAGVLYVIVGLLGGAVVAPAVLHYRRRERAGAGQA